MPLKPNTFTLFFFFFWFAAPASSSIYDALASHGLPIGLLPKGVRDYNLDGDGRFEARLDQPCEAQFETRFRFDTLVSGRIGIGRISEVAGISAQELFLWFPVKAVRVDLPTSGLIYFDVGVVFKQFPLYLFETPPNCLVAALPEGDSPIQTLVNKKQTRESAWTRKNLIMTKNQENKTKLMTSTSN